MSGKLFAGTIELLYTLLQLRVDEGTKRRSILQPLSGLKFLPLRYTMLQKDLILWMRDCDTTLGLWAEYGSSMVTKMEGINPHRGTDWPGTKGVL